MTVQSDLEVNRSIRKVFVRHWIDLGRLSIRSSVGRVSIYGSLQRIPGIRDELSPSIVEAIFNEIKRIQDVRLVALEIENWTNDSGMWRPTEKVKKVPQTVTREAPPRLVIEDTDKGPQSDKSG